MRLVSFNVQSGRPNRSWSGALVEDGLANDEAVREAAAELARLKPDVLALQEVREDRSRSILAAFAQSAELEHSRFAACRRAPSNVLARIFRRSRRGYGIAFATVYPIEYLRAVRLPSWRNPVKRASDRRFGWRFRVEEQRMAIVAVLLTPAPVIVGATHLTTKQPDNRKQLRHLEDFMAKVARRRGIPDAPRIVLGDLNTRLEDLENQTQYEVLAQALTYPDHEPSSQIDHILGIGFRAEGEATAHQLVVSDHRVLAVDIV